MKVCLDLVTRGGCRAENRDAARFCHKCGRPLANVLMLLDPGTVVQGRYAVQRIVGYGGNGAVYLVKDRAAGGIERALKESCDPARREQFRLEAATLQTLSHANLPKVYEALTAADRDYMVMDFIPGKSLGEILDERIQAGIPPLDEGVVVGYGYQICNALDYIHSREPEPVIHRDIKPDNIRLTPHGEIKLVDFGLVKRLDQANPATLKLAQGLTPAYASPEQWGLFAGVHTDPRSDIYSLAATLYHLLTGRPPTSAVDRITGGYGQPTPTDPLTPPRQINPAISLHVDRAIVRALAMQPEMRFQRARQFRHALALGTTAGLTPKER